MHFFGLEKEHLGIEGNIPCTGTAAPASALKPHRHLADPETMFGTLEEHLNYHDHIAETTEGEPLTDQLDLLIPVRRKAK